MKKRKCRKCSAVLPETRYFNCLSCVPPDGDNVEESEGFDDFTVQVYDGLFEYFPIELDEGDLSEDIEIEEII